MIAANLNRAVEIIYEGHDKDGPYRSVGSGSFVGPRLVLTALHNVRDADKLLVRVPGKGEYPAVVCLQGDEGSIDLAVLEVFDISVDVPSLRYGVVDQSVARNVEECWAIGFPRFKSREGEPQRRSAQIGGKIPTGDNMGLLSLTLLVDRSPRPLPLSSAICKSEWAGISGAVVFSGNDIIVGVITEHYPPEGESALTVVPITAIDSLPEAVRWWDLLGVDRQAFVPLPGFDLPANAEQQNQCRDWGNAPEVPIFFGRTKELLLLEQWIIQDHCHLVAIVGIGGIGKTELSVKLGRGGIGKTDLSLKLVRGIEELFDYVIWRRLLNPLKVSELLTDLIKCLSNQQEVTLPEKVDEQISRLLHYLRKSRCLIILDNVEGILQGGQYSPGYEEYGQLFERIAEVSHQSCFLLTSREKPPEIARRESETGPVRSLGLGGISVVDSQQIFAQIGSFSGSKQDWNQLNALYNGNPLALELAAHHIRDGFFGSISNFLREGKPIFADLRGLLDWHVNRLSDSHKEVMYWFAINREPITLSEIREDILSLGGKEQIASTLSSLQRLIPLEKSARSFTLQPVLIEYMTECLLEEVVDEVKSGKIHLFNTHALLKTSISDYVRESQRRLILKPISKKLLEIYGSRARLEVRLKEILSLLRESFRFTSGYAGGNLLNLLCYLEVDLRGYNFSGLPVWYAYLQGMNLQEVNFAHADLARSVFTDTFGNTLCVALSKHGDLLAVGTATGEIRLWHALSGLPVQTFRSHTDWVRSVAFSPDGKTLVSGSDDRTVCLWEVSSGELLNVLRGHTDIVSTVAFSPDGKLLASGSGDRTVCLWEVSSEKLLNTLQGHIDWVWSVAFSPDGKTLASGSGDRTTRLWEVSSGKLLNILQGHTDAVYTVAFSPDGKLLASGSGDRTVCLWEMGSEQLLNTLHGHMGWVRSVSFDPDGKTLASSGSDHTVRLWEVSSGQCLNTLQGHTDWIRSVAFSPDGKILGSSSDDRTVRLWEVSSGQCLNTLQGHTDWVTSVAFSPNGKIIASGGRDGKVCLWEVRSGKLLKTLQDHSYSVNTVAFSPDGKTLVSGSSDRTVRLWKVSSGQCLALQNHSHRV